MGEGRFVSFEGVEGAGKSTQVELLRHALAAAGREVVVAREPGGTPIGERVRAMLLDPVAAEMHPRAEALLFAAARAQLVEQVIRPALQRDATVLCDRYVDSSLAYQGGARGLGLDAVGQVNRWATGGLLPDLVVVLDLDPEQGLRRSASGHDRIERLQLAFHQAVRRAYHDLAEHGGARYLLVDADGSAAKVAERVRAAVLPRL